LRGQRFQFLANRRGVRRHGLVVRGLVALLPAPVFPASTALAALAAPAAACFRAWPGFGLCRRSGRGFDGRFRSVHGRWSFFGSFLDRRLGGGRNGLRGRGRSGRLALGFRLRLGHGKIEAPLFGLDHREIDWRGFLFTASALGLGWNIGIIWHRKIWVKWLPSRAGGAALASKSF
jgi:hypothetical protein